jgi:hypothetical protein
VLLGAKDRAEIASKEYRAVASAVMEGVIIVEPAPIVPELL